MNNLEKLRVLLPHWLEHNASHRGEFAHWAGLIGEGHQEVAVHLKRAADALQAADTALREALRSSGGELSGHGHHHHHHHNLPE